MAIHNSAKELSKELARISERLDIGIDRAARKAAFDMQARIIERTPVDTGRARASWGLAQGKPGRGVAPEKEYSEGEAERHAKTVLTTVRPGSPGLFRRVLRKVLGGGLKPYWVFNNLPYIEKLEFGGFPGDGPKTIGGYSTQAPAGMVRVSLAEAVVNLRAVATTEVDRSIRGK